MTEPEAPTTTVETPPPEAPPPAPAGAEVDASFKPFVNHSDLDKLKEVTVGQLTEMGVTWTQADFNLEENIPGLDLNWKQADFLDIAFPEGVKTLQAAKADPHYQDIDLFFIPGQKRKYVFRSTTRREWTNFVRQMRTFPERTKIEQENATNPEAAAGQIRTLMEELVFQKFCIIPQLSVDQVKDLPPGEVSAVYEAYMTAIGYTDQPPPVIKI